MRESWNLLLILLPLIAGAIAVLLSFQLMRRYRMPFLHSYFYYLVFLYIFGVYSLAGSGVLQFVLTQMEAQVKVVHAARFYTLLMGVPFLLLSKFMIIRSVGEFMDRKLHPGFTAGYFILAMFLFTLYGVLIVRFTRFDLGNYQRLISIQQWVFIGTMGLIYVAWAIWGFNGSRSISDPFQKKFLRLFILWYLLYMCFSVLALMLTSLHPVIPYLFLFIFLSWHLLPILFLTLYLEKHHAISPSAQQDFETRLSAFATEYEISKRELEVIRLICKGWSNQEISDNLHISLQTVKDHVHHIFLKTGIKNRVQLTNLIRVR
ncbi:MAG: response regulator transcription factor [Bacteroidales bacterium]